MVAAQAISQVRQAEQLVSRFVRRFDPSYQWLLYYAALPLILTPELLNYLRNQFLRSHHVPWVAEIDLLLSDLCAAVGDEQYAMDSHVRDYLVQQAAVALGQAELERVAKLLIRYVDGLAQTNQYLTLQERRAQQWAAMVFVDSERGRVAADIAAAFQDCNTTDAERPKALSLANQAEMIRLSRITQTLAPQLIGHEGLVQYARSVTQQLFQPKSLDSEQLQQTFQVGDMTLTLPVAVQPDLVSDFDLQTLDFFHGQLIDTDEEVPETPADVFSSLKTANFTIATVSLEDKDSSWTLRPFEFTVATLHRRSTKQQPHRKAQKQSSEWEIQRQLKHASCFSESLSNDLFLDMVSIPGGTFLMGSPKDEPKREMGEGPQHEVIVPDFFMGRYPITQAQWRFVANLPKINRQLQRVNRRLRPDPSRFKGDRLPVESVSWYEVTEFCDRLSAHTERTYRLPTEAEWEYACRAGTISPFHFGNTLTTEVANYDGNYTYADGPKGKYFQQTTPVDQFKIANAFGLCDMHGNVWEWCQDHYGYYAQTPVDGSVWMTDDEKASPIVRGGSWINYPWNCRTATRNCFLPENRNYAVGFRVCCMAPRSLL
jgi:formylglycine-generating enzyme required for sulfatase activity